jgi:hypothetical protein
MQKNLPEKHTTPMTSEIHTKQSINEENSSLSLKSTFGGFIKGILRGVRCTKSLRVLFLHRRPPSWTTLVLSWNSRTNSWVEVSGHNLESS